MHFSLGAGLDVQVRRIELETVKDVLVVGAFVCPADDRDVEAAVDGVRGGTGRQVPPAARRTPAWSD
ncbi:hypothetical protein [Streptomyces sp. NPDC001948]